MRENLKKSGRQVTPADKARGLRIKTARTKRELTQEQLADMLGVSNGLVGQWETGSTKLTAQKAAILERTLGVSMSWLLTGDDPNEIPRAQTETERSALEAFRSIPVESQETVLAMIQAAAKTLSRD